MSRKITDEMERAVNDYIFQWLIIKN